MGKRKRKRKTSTEKMMEALESCEACLCRNFPPEFLIGLRGAVDAGLSCEQITAFFVLVTGWYKACEKMDGESLVQRAFMLSKVMAEDAREEELEREDSKLRRQKKRFKSRD